MADLDYNTSAAKPGQKTELIFWFKNVYDWLL